MLVLIAAGFVGGFLVGVLAAFLWIAYCVLPK